MSGYSEEIPSVIPRTIAERARFVKGRYLEYKDRLMNGGGGTMREERARPIADELARGDLLSLLSRLGERAFRLQLEFEELHIHECEIRETVRDQEGPTA
ncbi:MAG TPA: hypothetical protein VGS23_07265 [Thermoplasmata archaeon]|nr:hypothetical protein [Thermoplasmata archaeon]